MVTATPPGEENKKDKPEGIVGWLRALGCLERRAARIFESRQAIVRIEGAIRETMLDIANLFTGNPSTGGRAELERALGNLQGLTKAAGQESSAAPSGGESGGSRAAAFDVSGLKAEIETRRIRR